MNRRDIIEKCNFYYNKIMNIHFTLDNIQELQTIENNVNSLLVELCKPLALNLANDLMEMSIKYANEVKNLDIVRSKVVKKLNQDCKIEITCENQTFTIEPEIYCKFEGIENFKIWKMYMRYFILTSIDKKSASLQAAVPYRFMKYINKHFGVNFECFASPVNSYFENYCSAFKDTDKYFGSQGNFLKYFPDSGSFEANPPFSEDLMLKMVNHMETLLESEEPFCFIIILPDWQDSEAGIKIKNSKYFITDIIAKKGEHFYRDITQKNHFPAIHNTRISILQNKSGSKKWKVTESNVQGLIENFVE